MYVGEDLHNRGMCGGHRYYRAHSHHFADRALGVWQIWHILNIWHAISSDDAVQLVLNLLLDVRIAKHEHDEPEKCRLDGLHASAE